MEIIRRGRRIIYFFIRAPFIRTTSLKLGQKIRIFQIVIIVRKLRCSYEAKEVGINVRIMLKIAYSQEKSAKNSILKLFLPLFFLA